MQLTSDQTRLILVALRTFVCDSHNAIARLGDCANLLIHPAFVAFGQYRQIARLRMRLNSKSPELHLDGRDIAIRALGRYAEALAESAEADDVGSDDFSSAERSGRERELKETARLLAGLVTDRPKGRRLAVAVRSAV